MEFNFEEFVQKYNVHPETIAFMMARAADNVKPYYEIGVDEARKTSIAAAEKYAGTIDFDGTETELIVPSPDCKDGIPVTVYRPTSCDQLEAPTVVVYFHGGGNVVGCRRTHAVVCKTLARDASCVFVNVEYRLGPEHKFPANQDDAKCVVKWIATNKTAVGCSNASKLGVSGDSAGGKMAAVVCHEANDVIDFAVLVYPNVNYNGLYPSIKEFANGPVLPKLIVEWFMGNYITDADKASVRASVILNKDFSYLPPTQIIVAELDPLRDGGYAYHDKLKEAGVDVDILTIKGVIHAFWSLPGAFKETCNEAHTAAVKFIRKHSA